MHVDDIHHRGAAPGGRTYRNVIICDESCKGVAPVEACTRLLMMLITMMMMMLLMLLLMVLMMMMMMMLN
jgi:hypothetical protein